MTERNAIHRIVVLIVGVAKLQMGRFQIFGDANTLTHQLWRRTKLRKRVEQFQVAIY